MKEGGMREKEKKRRKGARDEGKRGEREKREG